MLKPSKRQITFAFAAIACCAVTFIVGIGFGVWQPKSAPNLQFDNGPVCKIPIRVIEDNWPGSGDGHRPGPLDVTMGEESGRTYGRDVWLYEAEKVRGSQELKSPRSQEEMKDNLYQLLGHSINDCMGVVTKKDELVQVYKEDLSNLSAMARILYVDSGQDNDDSRALGCSSIIGVLIRQEDDQRLRDFPRTTAYLRRELIQK